MKVAWNKADPATWLDRNCWFVQIIFCPPYVSHGMFEQTGKTRVVAWCNRLSSVSGLTVQSVCTQGWWGWECDRLLMYGTLGHIQIQVTIMTFKHADSVGGTEVDLPTCTRNKTYTVVVVSALANTHYITLHFGEAQISTH